MASTHFLTRALEKILGEKDLKRSQHQQLRRVCEAALSEFWLAPVVLAVVDYSVVTQQ